MNSQVRPVVIFGAGGFSREVLALLRDINKVNKRWDILGFVDDREHLVGRSLDGCRVLGGRVWLENHGSSVHLALGVGDPEVKRSLAMETRDWVAGFPPLIHPSVIRTAFIEIGEGAIITAGNVLTSQIVLRPFSMLNLSCTIGHDSRIGAFATVAPGTNVSGNVMIGEGCNIGTGATIIQDISIGEWSVVGAGAVVTRDLPGHCTAVGVPAKVIKQRGSA